MSIKHLVVFTLLCMIAIPTVSIGFEGYAFTFLGRGHLSGFSQTPKGGSVGTTSMQRPQFSDVNIDHDNFYELGVGMTHNQYFLQLYYAHLAPMGKTVLAEDLLTHAQLIGKGNPFHMHVHYDWYQTEIGKTFTFCQDKWFISPLIDFNWVKYDYQFWAPTNQSSRTFTIANLAVGLEVETVLTQVLSSYLQVKIALPFTHLRVYTADLGLAYHYRYSPRIEFLPIVAAGFMHLDFEDEQPVPNHVRYTNFPYIKIGLQMNVLG